MEKTSSALTVKILISLLIFSVFLLSSCSQIAQRLAILSCKYSFLDVSPVNVGLTSLDLKLSIEISNPNSVDVILDKLGFDFFVNESKIFNGVMESKLNIPKGSNSILEHGIKISYIEAGTAIIKAIKGKKAAYRLRGKAYYDSPLGSIALPVDIVKGEVK